MSYFEPDPTWAIFSIPDFESYAKIFVVEGRFHKDVPEDVVKSYAVAEHIMAHAYYYYPMYEEALVKLLRTMEMAVRIRCEQIGITTTFTDKKGEIQGKNLGSLIDQLAKQESSKSIKKTLDGLRELRNIFMHPQENMLFGSTTINAIRHTLVQLNALFLPEQFFVEAQNALEHIQRQWQPFEKSICVLHLGAANGYGIYESRALEAYRSGNEWVYLWVFHPIIPGIRQQLESGHFPSSPALVLRDITIDPRGILRGRAVDDGISVTLFHADHPDVRPVYEQFQAELASVEPANLAMYKMSRASDEERERVRWRCVYWGL